VLSQDLSTRRLKSEGKTEVHTPISRFSLPDRFLLGLFSCRKNVGSYVDVTLDICKKKNRRKMPLGSKWTKKCLFKRNFLSHTKPIPNNTTGYTTSVEVTKLHLKKKPGNSTINKIQYAKAYSCRTANKNMTSEPATERLKAQITKKQNNTRPSRTKTTHVQTVAPTTHTHTCTIPTSP
jgi:hypothetical protein